MRAGLAIVAGAASAAVANDARAQQKVAPESMEFCSDAIG